MSELHSDALAAIDNDALGEAWAAYAAVASVHNGTVARVTAADEAVAHARLKIETLVAQASEGVVLDDVEIISAYLAEKEATALATFYALVKSRTAIREAQARADYRVTEADAKSGMIPWAITRRIDAARRLDEAEAALAAAYERCQAAERNVRAIAAGKLWPAEAQLRANAQAEAEARTAEKAMLEARAAVKRAEETGAAMCEEASAVFHDRGALRPHMPRWPSTEAAERLFWNVPAPEPEVDVEPAEMDAAA